MRRQRRGGSLRWRVRSCVFALMLLAAGAAAAQGAANPSIQATQAGTARGNGEEAPAAREIHAAPLAAPMTIDGQLDEPAWLDAPVADGFTQREPLAGDPATAPGPTSPSPSWSSSSCTSCCGTRRSFRAPSTPPAPRRRAGHSAPIPAGQSSRTPR